MEAVPGCGGTGVSGVDYCYVPEVGDLTLMGNDGFPSENFPLKECQGDCDFDEDCGFGLNCYQRDDESPVPGCNGGGNWGKFATFSLAVLQNVFYHVTKKSANKHHSILTG